MGLMNRILQMSGTSTGEGLLQRAAKLRERAESFSVDEAGGPQRGPDTAVGVAAEKKKHSIPSLAIAA